MYYPNQPINRTVGFTKGGHKPPTLPICIINTTKIIAMHTTHTQPAKAGFVIVACGFSRRALIGHTYLDYLENVPRADGEERTHKLPTQTAKHGRTAKRGSRTWSGPCSRALTWPGL